MKRYSLILTAANEANTVDKALDFLLRPEKSGLESSDLELITVIPDPETQKAADEFMEQNFPALSWVKIKDPHQGKPTALNMAFKAAQGDFLLLTDGDVHLEKNAVKHLFSALVAQKDLGGVTGRPVSADNKNTYWGFLGHILADAAHHKRTASMRRDIGGHSLSLVKSGPGFFAMSGYIIAMRNLHLLLPVDVLSDDAFISYAIINQGLEIGYVPEAKVAVKYPQNLADWYNQKSRSLGGYMQLYKYGVVAPDKKVRNFWKELEYFWFPFYYARSLKEFIWSSTLYPLRLFLWVRIFWEQKILKKDFSATWVRINSTK